MQELHVPSEADTVFVIDEIPDKDELTVTVKNNSTEDEGLSETTRLKVSVGQPSPVPVYEVPEGTVSVNSLVTGIKPEFESTIL